MNISINEELRNYIDPLTATEYAALERSMLAEGCRDALVLWGDMLIDGHNRYAICRKHGLEFRTVQNTRFMTIEDVMLWMIDNHLARRSVSDFQRGVLALRKKDLVAARSKPQPENETANPERAVQEAAAADTLNTREDVARIAGISSNTISRIEKIQKTAAPELVQAVRSGTISINAAAAVATLPSEQQVAAVAGGKKELQQAAKQVRGIKSPAEKPARAVTSAATSIAIADGDIAALNARVDELTAENAVLQTQIAELTSALEDARRTL